VFSTTVIYGVACHCSYGCRPYDDVTFNTTFGCVNQTKQIVFKSRFECQTILSVTRHLPYRCFNRNFICFLWSRSMMLWSLHTENTRLISRGIIFDVLRPIWSRYLNVTDTFCQFCSIYGINDLESRLEVIQGRWFWHESKARIFPIGPQYSILNLVLSCHVYTTKAAFSIPFPYSRQNFRVFSLEWCWGLLRANQWYFTSENNFYFNYNSVLMK